MATTSVLFSSSAGSTILASGRNRIATFSVNDCSSMRIYAFLRPNTPQSTVYVINSDLHDHVGTDPDAGALDSFVLNAIQGHSAWYPPPGQHISIEVFTSGAGGIDLFVYGLK